MPSPSYQYFNLTYPLPLVAHVEINRPAKMNAFIQAMWLELRSVFSDLSHNSSTRAIVLSGAGTKAFTAGLDFKAEFVSQEPTSSSSSSSPGFVLGQNSTPPQKRDTARVATSLRRHIAEFQDCVSAVERCEKPIIVALHGHTIGLGIEIALCCDVRICAADTQFAVKEVDLGVAADIGALSRLGKSVGSESWLKDVCLSGRLFGAEEARKVGLVSWVAPESPRGGKEAVIEEAVRWAGVIAGKSPVAVQGTKELLNWSRDHTVQDGLRYTNIWNSAMIQSTDPAIAMKARMEKKNPRFEKL